MVTEPGSSAGNAGERPFRSGDSTSRRVLEDVLKQTAALYSLENATDPADLEPLLQVARQYRGMDLQLDPVLIELVRATLRRQVSQNSKSEAQLAEVADRVARTLYENPETLERVNALWIQLLAVA